MAIVPTQGKTVGPPGPGGGLNIGGAASAISQKYQAMGNLLGYGADVFAAMAYEDKRKREAYEQRLEQLEQNVELAKSQTDAAEYIIDLDTKSQSTPDIEQAEQVWQEGLSDIGQFRPTNNEELGLKWDVWWAKYRLQAQTVHERLIRERRAEAAMRESERQMTTALRMEDRELWEQQVEQNVGILWTAETGKALKEEFGWLTEIQQLGDLADDETFGSEQLANVAERLQEINTVEGLSEQTQSRIKQASDRVSMAAGQKQRQEEELRDKSEAEAFDRLMNNTLDMNWLQEQRLRGAIAETDYQHYVQAVSRRGEIETDPATFDALVEIIDKAAAGDATSLEAREALLAAHAAGKLSRTDYKSLRRNVTAATKEEFYGDWGFKEAKAFLKGNLGWDSRQEIWQYPKGQFAYDRALLDLLHEVDANPDLRGLELYERAIRIALPHLESYWREYMEQPEEEIVEQRRILLRENEPAPAGKQGTTAEDIFQR